jgi:hypothetical protein
MPNLNIARRRPAAGVISILTLACLGLGACGGSSGTSTNAAATSAGSTPTSASSSTQASTSTSTQPSTSTPTQPLTSRSTRPSTSTPQHSGQSSIAAAFAARRECLRKSGIALPNPAAGLGAGVKLPKGMTHAQYEAALRKCSGAVSAAPRLNNPTFTRALAKYAECLRQNGVNVPVPNTSGKGPVLDTSGVKISSPQFRAASLKCRATLIGAFRNLSRAGRP